MYRGIAAQRRDSKQRICGIVALVGVFAAFFAMFGGAYMHDYMQSHAHYHAGILGMIALGVSGTMVAVIALVVGAE